MKAIVYAKYGSPDVLQVKDVEKPIPKDDEVLIKVHAASANAADWHLLKGKPFLVRLMGFGLLKPKNKILGADIAGRVEAVGRNVKQFQPSVSWSPCGGEAPGGRSHEQESPRRSSPRASPRAHRGGRSAHLAREKLPRG